MFKNWDSFDVLGFFGIGSICLAVLVGVIIGGTQFYQATQTGPCAHRQGK